MMFFLTLRSLRFTPISLLVSSLIGAIALLPRSAQAQSLTQGTVIEILDSDQVYIQDRRAKVNDSIQLGEQIRTDRARVGVRFNVEAGARLGQNSALELEAPAVGNCLRIKRGKVLIAGAPKRPTCLGRVTAQSRGTVYVTDLEDNGQGKITVLEGSVEVSNISQDNQLIALAPPASPRSVVVSAGQSVVVSTNGEIDDPFQVTSAQLNNVALPLLEGFQQPLPDLEKITILATSVRGFVGTFLQDAIVGGDSFGSDSFEREDPFKGKPSFDLSGTSIPGVFVRRGQNFGVFRPFNNQQLIPISIDFKAQTISINGVSGVANNLGLSGSNASGTVILQNGQAVRIQVQGLGFKEPVINVPYAASLSGGRVRDR
jgi:hypothetical protein